MKYKELVVGVYQGLATGVLRDCDLGSMGTDAIRQSQTISMAWLLYNTCLWSLNGAHTRGGSCRLQPNLIVCAWCWYLRAIL